MFIVDIVMPARLSSKRDIVTTRNFTGLDCHLESRLVLIGFVSNQFKLKQSKVFLMPELSLLQGCWVAPASVFCKFAATALLDALSGGKMISGKSRFLQVFS